MERILQTGEDTGYASDYKVSHKDMMIVKEMHLMARKYHS